MDGCYEEEGGAWRSGVLVLPDICDLAWRMELPAEKNIYRSETIKGRNRRCGKYIYMKEEKSYDAA